MTFQPFPKIPRLRRDIVITEKLDGTNASIWIEPAREGEALPHSIAHVFYPLTGDTYTIRAGSRNRFITPENDNYGFAGWVQRKAFELIELGPGVHYGEWWGQGIQRKYGLSEKRFSLFNVGRWDDQHGTNNRFYPNQLRDVVPPCCHVVPLMYIGVMNMNVVDDCLLALTGNGSRAAPGFMNPEGVVVFHKASGQLFKQTLDHNDAHKEAA